MSPLQHVLAKITRGLRLMIGRCVLTAIDDSTGIQLVDVSTISRTRRSRLEHFQPYGLSSRPRVGAEGLVAFLGGSQDHGIVFMVGDRRYRLKPLQDGGCALHDHLGDYIEIRPADREIKLVAQKVTISASTNRIEGPLTVTGFAQFEGSVKADGSLTAGEVTSENAGLNMTQVRNTYNAHTHPGGGAPNPQM